MGYFDVPTDLGKRARQPAEAERVPITLAELRHREEAHRAKDSPAEARGAAVNVASTAFSQGEPSTTHPSPSSSPAPLSPNPSSPSRRTTVVDITGTDEEFDHMHEETGSGDASESDAPPCKRTKREFF